MPEDEGHGAQTRRCRGLFPRTFSNVHVDTRGDTTTVNFDGREMAEQDVAFGIHRATPVFIIFDTRGQPIQRYTAASTLVDEFLWPGEFIVSGACRRTNLNAYKRNRLQARNP